MKKNASRLCLKAFFFIYYDQVLNNLYTFTIPIASLLLFYIVFCSNNVCFLFHIIMILTRSIKPPMKFFLTIDILNITYRLDLLFSVIVDFQLKNKVFIRNEHIEMVCKMINKHTNLISVSS